MTHAMNALELNPDCDLNIAFVEDDYMTELHIKWMDEPGTTDVLSFPMDMPEEPGQAVTLGDIVISPVVAAAQALQQGHSTEHEIYILATHGLLHIIGYDHADKADEKIMFELQEKIVTDWEKRSCHGAHQIMDAGMDRSSRSMFQARNQGAPPLQLLGFGSKMVVTGDVTQIDLPNGQNSGLRVIRDILKDINLVLS